jgi:hypothetical protein
VASVFFRQASILSSQKSILAIILS